jgi:hypothetical protein
VDKKIVMVPCAGPCGLTLPADRLFVCDHCGPNILMCMTDVIAHNKMLSFNLVTVRQGVS